MHDGTAAVVAEMLPWVVVGVDPVNDAVFLFEVFFLGEASLPAAPPLADQELEAVRIYADALLEENADIALDHLILIMVVVK